jgi:hypothetical protein
VAASDWAVAVLLFLVAFDFGPVPAVAVLSFLVAFDFGPVPAVAVLSFLVAFGFEPAHESRGGMRLTE